MERRALALAAPLALGLLACNLDLPSEYRIEDLRVLDLQVEPPEVSVFEPSGTGTTALSFDPMNPPPIAHQPVRVRALVAHPDLAASFEYDWIRCKPGLDRVPCDGTLASALVPERTAEMSFTPIDVLFADVTGGTKLEDLAAALAEDPRDLLNGLYAYVNLQAGVGQASIAVDTQRIQATKRIVVFDPRVVALALEQARALDPSQIPMGAGLPTLCAGVSDAQLALLNGFLASREPNRTPRMLGVSVVITHLDGSITATITSAEGSVLDLEDTDLVTLEGLHLERRRALRPDRRQLLAPDLHRAPGLLLVHQRGRPEPADHHAGGHHDALRPPAAIGPGRLFGAHAGVGGASRRAWRLEPWRDRLPHPSPPELTCPEPPPASRWH